MEQSELRAAMVAMLSSLQEQLGASGARSEVLGPIQRAMLKGYVAEYLTIHADPVLGAMLREFPEQPTLLDAVVVLREMLRERPTPSVADSGDGLGSPSRPAQAFEAGARAGQTVARFVTAVPQRIREAPSAALRSVLWMCIATDRFSDTLKILFVSTMFTLLALNSEAITTSPDTHQFAEWSIAMAQGSALPVQPIYASRNIGYPLLLWISGYPYTHSLLGITVIQTVMAAFIPLLVYSVIRPVSAAAGYYSAMASVLSLSPFYTMKYISHDLAFGFLLVLSAYLCVQYFISRRESYLYWGTASFLMTAVTNPMGNLLFPTFLILAFLFVGGPTRRYVVCLAVGIVLLLGNVYYRHMLFRVPLGHPMPTIVGSQSLYSPYLNSHEYGIRLSPAIGPAMGEIIDRVDRAVPEDPRRLSSVLGDRYEGPGKAEFAQQYFYSLTAEQLRSQIFTLPNFEYYEFIVGAANDERLDLAATLEIYRRYPAYVAAFTLRNVWLELAAPGERHAQFSGSPFMVRMGNPFPLDNRGYTDLERFPAGAPAIKELRFSDQPVKLAGPARWFLDRVRGRWPTISRWTVDATFLLVLGGLILLGLKYASGPLRRPRFVVIKAALDDVFPVPLDLAFLTAAIMLLELYVVMGMFTEADLRIWHEVEGLRIVVAGLAAGAFARLLANAVMRSADGRRFVSIVSTNVPRPAAATRMILAVALASFAVYGLASWVMYLVRHTG